MESVSEKKEKPLLIECDNLSKSFGRLVAVDQVSFKVHEGEIVGLVGPDGAGKTTLIRMLTSVLPPSGGNAFIDGFSILSDEQKIQDRIGYVSQQFGLYGDLTVMENLHFFGDVFGVENSEKNQRIEELLEFSQLKDFKDFQAEKLSGGMKQKLSLSCALIHRPKVLFLDEPTNGVDPVSRRDFWNILRSLNERGTTVFLSTAYLDEAERCGKIIFLHKGGILACGTLNQLRRSVAGNVVEIKCKTPRIAFLKLRNLFGTDVVKLFGNRIHVFLFASDTPGTIETVEKILTEAGIVDASITSVAPTLEDIFMALMRGKDDDEV
ncbi:ABC transporter ATP-binding protein [Estrella lausannensis]|uniref:ABC transporter ATP-binding component n=1 Tax=Estrella lausannensis TaxID=483423 RepID=A0A0H5DQP4_9BACT|nr:ABC transporter ATP-binding protein [Estrella lausannensis]CRX38867.1 ABC transporter ATP-binding component [Estrella lausannensis]